MTAQHHTYNTGKWLQKIATKNPPMEGNTIKTRTNESDENDGTNLSVNTC